MAELLEIVLREELSPDVVIDWLKKSPHNADSLPDVLGNSRYLRQEFVPFFLNYLRDITLHLIQGSKSTNPSPAKTPNFQRFRKNNPKNDGSTHTKRQQLFEGSTATTDGEDVKPLQASVLSPNTSIDSPGHVIEPSGQAHRGSKQFSGYQRANQGQRSSPHYEGQKSSQCTNFGQTPDSQRSKKKLSLGEFLLTPDSSSWKKKSPHSNKRESLETSSSPSPQMVRRSGGGKKKHHQLQGVNRRTSSPTPAAPIFSLSSVSDFPPVEQQDKNSSAVDRMDQILSRRPPQTNDSTTSNHNKPNHKCNPKTSRLLNFSDPVKDETGKVNLRSSIDRSCVQKTEQVCNGGAITERKPRRITPVFLKAEALQPQNSAFLVPFENDSKQGVDSSKPTVIAERRENPDNLDSQIEPKEVSSCSEISSSTPSELSTPSKSNRCLSVSSMDIVEATPELVTYRHKLDLLVTLYSGCLDGNLLPNIAVELFFLIQLLTARGGNPETPDTGYLDLEDFHFSVHNAVYFSVNVLQKQQRFLYFLDKGSLRLLSENQRVAKFSAALQSFLQEVHKEVHCRTVPAFPRSPIGSVSFQVDTDNRKNFPSDRSFHLFRRQRDGFYELIREWEDNHLNPGWNFTEMLSHKIRALINYRTELANHIHFARLFQSQLIAMCKGDGSLLTEGDEDNIALLSHLKRTNPEKFQRLQERFIKPLSVGGPCPLPSFPGCQEFFHDFILVACNPVFNQHLSDTLSSKLMELNSTSFSSRTNDDHEGANEEEEEKELFTTILLTLRVLGKFLGFITFLPYQSSDKLPDTIQPNYIAVRNRQLPLLDVCNCVHTSIRSGHLTLTVPWVSEFLSMMDISAPRLDYFQTLLFLLLHIHRYIWLRLQSRNMSCYSDLMVVSVISWLFENPAIPEGFFFMDIPSDIIVDTDWNHTTKDSMDNRGYVDQSLYYTCCPYMGELKTLLVEFAIGTNSKTSAIRKITPVSAEAASHKTVSDKQLQVQMEENFFHNHPASLKRVVEFVADRTASNFIKKFRAGLLQESLTSGKEKVLEALLQRAPGSPSSKMKDNIVLETSRVAHEMHGNVKSKVSSEAGSYCHTRVKALMPLMLPDDQSSTVVSMAASISTKMAEQKITQWMNKHITFSMYQTELMPDLEKVTKAVKVQQELDDSQTELEDSVQVSCVRAQEHREDRPHPSLVLIQLKDTVKNHMLGSEALSPVNVTSLLTEIKDTLLLRQDIIPAVYKSFSQLIAELLVSIVVYQPEIFQEDIIKQCTSLWKQELTGHAPNVVFSGRVIYLLQTKNSRTSWSKYGQLLTVLLKGDILSSTHLRTEVLSVLNTFTDQSTVETVGFCVCQAVESAELGRSEELDECLEWIYQLCGEHSNVGHRILKYLDPSKEAT